MKQYTRQAFLAGLLLLLPAVAVSAYAQQGMPTEVSGKYTNAANGVEITFPDGWSGFEISPSAAATMVMTGLGGISDTDSQNMKSIILLIGDKAERDIDDPSSFNEDVSDCNDPSIESRSVAGVDGRQITVECPATGQKFRMVAVETSDNIVAVMYTSPMAEFDANLAAFDSAVSSLTVQGASSIPGAPTTPGTPTEQEPTTSMMPVTVGEDSIQVAVKSSSTIAGLALDEETKMVSFKTDGTGTNTTVSIGKVLEGAYTVMVDDKATTDFTESTDADGTKAITVSHGAGAHVVSISGTQVVPEFPLAALGAIAAVVGVIAVLGRTRIVGK